MRLHGLAFLVAACATRAPVASPGAVSALPEVDVIAFGSCNQQADPQGFWDVIAAVKPDLFIAAGDNVYADVVVRPDGGVDLLPGDLGRLDAAYALLAEQEPFQRFREAVPILPTWDDHDYGRNDAGADLAIRSGSEARFLDFWGVPASDARRSRPGVYTSATYGPPGRRVQVILLDTRSFRGPLQGVPAPEGQRGIRYVPSADTTSSMLGAAQWAWLEGVLQEPAELRLVVSSIQVLADRHPYERWGNLPHEQARLLALIESTAAQGVVLLSGDRHLGALYRTTAGPYPLYEVTSSSLNRTFGRDEVDGARLGGIVSEDNFGTVRVDWGAGEVHLELRSAHSGVTVRTVSVALSALAPAP